MYVLKCLMNEKRSTKVLVLFKQNKDTFQVKSKGATFS